jgi:hypothetical protein
MMKWHSGPPPSMGWWPCRLKGEGFYDFLRWWNGERWSLAVSARHAAESAAKIAITPTHYTTRQIQWSARPDSWPARSKT